MSKIADSGIGEQQRQLSLQDVGNVFGVFNNPEWEEAFTKVGFYDLELQCQVMEAELQQLKTKRFMAMNEAIAIVIEGGQRKAGQEAQGGIGSTVQK